MLRSLLLLASALFYVSAAHAVLTNVQVPAALQISATDPTAARARLQQMNVKYLWKMDGSDVSVVNGRLQVADFMGNSTAVATNSLVSAQDCYRREGELIDSYVLFERPSADFPVGGGLRVQEKQPWSRVEATDEFSFGGWFKQHPFDKKNFRAIEPRFLAGGYMPALTRFAPSSANAHGGMEWMFHMTNEIAYANINRGWTGQNDMNHGLPWWAHTYGTCYDGRYHEECWHYVSISIKPSANTVQFLIIHPPGWAFGNPAESDMIATGITNANLNSTAIPQIAGAFLQIGSNESTGTHGLIRGLWFARKALSFEESKAISHYTAPSKKGFLCSGNNLLPRVF